MHLYTYYMLPTGNDDDIKWFKFVNLWTMVYCSVLGQRNKCWGTSWHLFLCQQKPSEKAWFNFYSSKQTSECNHLERPSLAYLENWLGVDTTFRTRLCDTERVQKRPLPWETFENQEEEGRNSIHVLYQYRATSTGSELQLHCVCN